MADDDCQQASADYSNQITDAERQLRDLTSRATNAGAFVRFAELHLKDLSSLWQMANDDQKRRVQTILFRGGFAYSQKTKSLNPGNAFQGVTGHEPQKFLVGVPDGI